MTQSAMYLEELFWNSIFWVAFKKIKNAAGENIVDKVKCEQGLRSVHTEQWRIQDFPCGGGANPLSLDQKHIIWQVLG